MNQKFGSSDLDSGATWQHRAELALASVTTTNRLITYAELANAATIPPPHRIHKLTLWLETKLVEDYQAGARLRTARVISRSRGGLPAPGFFIKCRELGLYNGPADGPLARAFHLNLLG